MFSVGGYHWAIFANSGLFDPQKKLRDYSKAEWEKFLHHDDPKLKVKSIGNMKSPYEGLIVKFKRLYLGKDPEKLNSNLRPIYERIVTRGPCDTCEGTRLSEAARACRIDKKSIADVSAMPIGELLEWMKKLKAPAVATLQARIVERLGHLVEIGLGYLTMSRATATLSGGESQRVKMVRHLGATLTDMVYIFDEPTIGLHPHDIERLNRVLTMLRDKGNTVLVVEHKPQVMAIADHIVDMGPGAGKSRRQGGVRRDFR
jgi:excinuclease UvrABC ATPase subunit